MVSSHRGPAKRATPIGGSYDDDSAAVGKAVHEGEHGGDNAGVNLVAAAAALAARRHQAVQLVQEDDRRRLRGSLRHTPNTRPSGHT